MFWVGFSINGKAYLAFVDEEWTTYINFKCQKSISYLFAYHYYRITSEECILMHVSARPH